MKSMQIHRVEPVSGTLLHASAGQLARFQPLLKADRNVFAGVLHLAPGGKLGPHEASVPRLVLVIKGSGRLVGGSATEDLELGPGDAVLWEAGESIGIGTSGGLLAIVFEGSDLQVLSPSDPARSGANAGNT